MNQLAGTVTRNDIVTAVILLTAHVYSPTDYRLVQLCSFTWLFPEAGGPAFGIRAKKALLFGVYVKAPAFWKPPHDPHEPPPMEPGHRLLGFPSAVSINFETGLGIL